MDDSPHCSRNSANQIAMKRHLRYPLTHFPIRGFLTARLIRKRLASMNEYHYLFFEDGLWSCDTAASMTGSVFLA